MTTKRKLQRIISLQEKLIGKLQMYYLTNDKGENRWIEAWYDTLTVQIANLKREDESRWSFWKEFKQFDTPGKVLIICLAILGLSLIVTSAVLLITGHDLALP